MLEEARNLEPLEVELNEARLRLEELAMRKSIRDASEGEYRVKMPAIKWEIEHYEEGLRKEGEDNLPARHEKHPLRGRDSRLAGESREMHPND
jgi:hypothetical protein